MVDEITRLLSDPSEANRLGKLGHEAVTDSHTWDSALAPLLAAVTP